MKLPFLVVSFFGLMAAAGASACPNTNLYGDSYELSGSDMYNPQSVSVVAGGDQQIANCGINFGSDKGTAMSLLSQTFR